VSAAVIGVSLFSHLGGIGLVGPDEPRYAWIARAMAETGDWVTPRLYGKPWFEKPVLYYWAAGAGFLAHLPPEWAARLPSALAALAAAVAIGWLAWKYYGSDARGARDCIWLAPLVFSTSVAAIGFARAATPDMLFSSSLTLVMASAATALRHAGVLRGPAEAHNARRRDLWALVLFGAFLGLSVLAKGPAAVLLTGGAVGLWAMATKQWRAAWRLAHPMAIAAFCIVALPWYIVCARHNADFLRIFIFEHNVERYLTPVFHHRQPFWFFGPIVLLALLPWTALLWPAAREGGRLWRTKSWRDSPGLFLACWAVFPILFFSFSQSKLPSYILPAIPPLTLLCSVGASRAASESRALSAGLGAGVGVAWIALGVTGVVFARNIPWVNFNHVYTPGLVAFWCGLAILLSVLVAVAVAVAAFYRRARLAFVLSGVCVAVALGAGAKRVFPTLDAFYSARPHAKLLRSDRRPDRIFTYRLDRSWNYGLAFYFHRMLPEWSLADSDPALVLTTPEALREIPVPDRLRSPLEENYVGIIYAPVPGRPR